MSAYIDTYVSHADKSVLETFASNFFNYIPVNQGQTGKGDPSLFYTCIRTTFDISPLVVAPFAIVDAVTGASVVGVWE